MTGLGRSVDPPEVIRCDRTFRFPVGREEIWRALERFDRFETWWGWLSDFRAEQDGMRPGNILSGVVSPPVPYRMTLLVRIVDCVRGERIVALVAGDLAGRAELVFRPHGTGTEVLVTWRLEMLQPRMRLAARVAGPVLRWGHDRVVEVTVNGFRRQLARRR